MLKDLQLILEAAAALHVPIPQTAATQQQMQSAVARGWGGSDYAVILKCAEEAAGLRGEGKEP